jgi:hypothetical protein
MQHLPPNFADDLAQVLEPSDRGAAAGIINAANPSIARPADDDRDKHRLARRIQLDSAIAPYR